MKPKACLLRLSFIATLSGLCAWARLGRLTFRTSSAGNGLSTLDMVNEYFAAT